MLGAGRGPVARLGEGNLPSPVAASLATPLPGATQAGHQEVSHRSTFGACAPTPTLTTTVRRVQQQRAARRLARVLPTESGRETA